MKTVTPNENPNTIKKIIIMKRTDDTLIKSIDTLKSIETL